jgi:hypothetical protein
VTDLRTSDAEGVPVGLSVGGSGALAHP